LRAGIGGLAGALGAGRHAGDRRSTRSQSQGDGPTDATGRAGHHGHFAAQGMLDFSHVRLLLLGGFDRGSLRFARGRMAQRGVSDAQRCSA
jgi:hypothetical protein